MGASCYIIAAFMGTSIYVIPFIILAGFIMGIADPESSALIADITTPKNRENAYSLFYMAINVGFAVSPLIGGFFFEKYLSLLFIFDALTAFMAMLMIFMFIPETINKTKDNLGEDRKLEKRVEGSLIGVLKERPILVFYALVMFGYSFVYSQWGFMYPILAERVVPDGGAKFYGSLVSFNALIVITLTPLITKLLSGKSSLRRIIYGGIFYALGFGMPGFLSSIPSMFAATFILTLGEIVVSVSSGPFIANHTPASHRGRMNAVLPMIIGFGYTIGPSIMGRVLNISGISVSWRIVGFVMIMFTAFAVMLEKYDRKTSDTLLAATE
jgi:MFS family permease